MSSAAGKKNQMKHKLLRILTGGGWPVVSGKAHWTRSSSQTRDYREQIQINVAWRIWNWDYQISNPAPSTTRPRRFQHSSTVCLVNIKVFCVLFQMFIAGGLGMPGTRKERSTYRNVFVSWKTFVCSQGPWSYGYLVKSLNCWFSALGHERSETKFGCRLSFNFLCIAEKRKTSEIGQRMLQIKGKRYV